MVCIHSMYWYETFYSNLFASKPNLTIVKMKQTTLECTTVFVQGAMKQISQNSRVTSTYPSRQNTPRPVLAPTR